MFLKLAEPRLKLERRWIEMPATNVKSKWSSGNLIFTGEADNVFIQFGQTDKPLQSKFHNRPAITGSTIEVRARPSSATAEHFAVDSTIDWRPTGDNVTGGGIRSIQGIARLDAGKTITGGSMTGVYGQVALNATAMANGAGVMMNAIYGLIEDGGTFTAVSHLAAAWLDSHLTKTVTAGETEFLYISNNGSTTFNQAIYVYAGNKITNLFRIDTATGMVSANTAAKTNLDFENWRTIKINIDGTTHYIPAAQAVTATGG
jgi:hypothetical protein